MFLTGIPSLCFSLITAKHNSIQLTADYDLITQHVTMLHTATLHCSAQRKAKRGLGWKNEKKSICCLLCFELLGSFTAKIGFTKPNALL